MLLNAKGQMTVFFATTVLALITFIAFIVNIGIFVKAKINLQNAVDAAAYAGASVQARQLSNIAYLNWEMRNTYKEWMFKTYILGNMSLPQVSGPSGNPVDFRMEPYQTSTRPVVDGYNFPSTCLDFSASGNVAVCRKALIPGLPSFDSTDVFGMEETMDAFVNAVSAQKADDCSKRSGINFMTNFLYAYNIPPVGDATPVGIAAQAPEISRNRMGAFPAAFDLALRIRNLEAQVNRAPYSGVCEGGSPYCSQRLDELIPANGNSPADERIYKAFQSAWRNLGGTNCSSGNADELKCTFTLSELAPRVPDLGNEFTLSKVLIPSSKVSALQKYYLDLKLMPVNYATFFTMLAPVTTSGGYETSGITADAASECVATKVGMPVPGYPLGFVKNPDVLTYYAVKGEAQFIGLFNPFAQGAVKLTAFAAAKPFGGRIGPMLFNVEGNTSYLKPRASASHFKSSPYLSALNNTNPVDRFGQSAPGNDYMEGMPLPGDYAGMPGNFWLKDETSAVGGWINEKNIFFAIPNIPYDYPTSSPQNKGAYFSDSSLQVITPLMAGSSPNSSAGLYNGEIFNKLKSKLEGLGTGGNIPLNKIDDAITISRAPTLYDAYNYLIPTPEDVNEELGTDSFGTILSEQAPQEVQGHLVYQMSLYAPLLSKDDPNALYNSPADLSQVLNDYMSKQNPALDKYRGAMNVAAKLVYEKNFSTRTGDNYGLQAAQSLSNFGDANDFRNKTFSEVYELKPTCSSTSGQFIWFFTGDSSRVSGSCDPDTTLVALMESYWSNIEGTEAITHHKEKFALPINLKKQLYSAYRPGRLYDGDSNGNHVNFLNGSKTNMNRNFYSSKFVTLRSVSNQTGEDTMSGNFAIFSEGERTKSGPISESSSTFKNYLDSLSFGVDLSEIRH